MRDVGEKVVGVSRAESVFKEERFFVVVVPLGGVEKMTHALT